MEREDWEEFFRALDNKLFDEYLGFDEMIIAIELAMSGVKERLRKKLESGEKPSLDEYIRLINEEVAYAMGARIKNKFDTEQRSFSTGQEYEKFIEDIATRVAVITDVIVTARARRVDKSTGEL